MWFARPHQPDLLGYLDRVAAGRVSGWVRDRLRPGARLDIEVFAAGALLGRTRADGFRQDLRDSGLGDGHHAFSFALHDAVLPETLAAKVAGTGYWLLDGLDSGMNAGALMNGARQGLPVLRPGLTVHAVDEADIAVAARLQRDWQAYAATMGRGGTVSRGPMWTDIVAKRHRPLLDLLRGSDAAALARGMVDIHKSKASSGLFQGAVACADANGATPQGRRAAVLPFHDMLASLARYLGLRRVECADLDAAGAALASRSEDLVAAIEAFLGHQIVPPVVHDGLFGLAVRGAVLHGRDVQALYAALRAIEVASQAAPRLAEIGGGFGRVAYYAMLRGCRGYTIVDLPTVAAMQYFTLARSLPDVPLRFGPVAVEGGINLVFATDDDLGPSLDADVVVNCDSFPEMGEAVCRGYFDLLAKRRARLLSINQEAARPVGAAGVQAVVGDILPDYGFRRGYRFRT